jgi:protein O-GlcNAc transferase
VQHHRGGRLADAERLYGKVLARAPNHANAAFLLGVLALESGRVDPAADLFARAVRLAPQNAAYQANLGEAQRRLRRLGEATDSLARAIVLNPDMVAAVYNLGLVLQETGELDRAASMFRRALELDPRLSNAHCNLGNVLVERFEIDDAIAHYRRALEIHPDLSQALNGLGSALVLCGLLDDAIALYRRALASNPAFPEAHSNLVYNMHFQPQCDARAILTEARSWDLRHAQPLATEMAPHTNDLAPNRRLRVGYVSPNFRHHCQAFFLSPLLRHHDREAFEIFCYSDVARPDDWTRGLLGTEKHTVSIATMTDSAVAKRIRDDRIDILVDLTMHMAHHRLQVFARKPAPIQVCWLAYPGTTGLSAMDYRITDVHLDPPDRDDGDSYSEQSIRLPDSFWCYDPLAEEHALDTGVSRDNGAVVFGCLNNFCKVNDLVIEQWARTLHATEGARLTLLVPAEQAQRRTLETFQRHRIDPARIEFVGYEPRDKYLARYRAIDVCLDTFPYNGHTTSLDASWMGVPVVTLVGSTVVGRAGLCQAVNLGLPELVAGTPDEYVKIAVDLARDRPRLATLRSSLRQRMKRSPLMDAPRFARNLEAAYRTMWLTWLNTRSRA